MASDPIKVKCVPGLSNVNTGQVMISHNDIYEALAEIADLKPLNGSINLFVPKTQDPNLPWQPVFRLTKRGFVEVDTWLQKNQKQASGKSFHPAPDVIFNLVTAALRSPFTKTYFEGKNDMSIIIDTIKYTIYSDYGNVFIQFPEQNQLKEVDLSDSQKEDIMVLATARYKQVYG